jgi:hypothetical protein
LAETFAGQQLTQAHRQRQLALRAATVRDLLRLWPAFDIDDIDGSWPALETALLALIRDRHRVSSGLAANYYRAFRVAEGVDGEPRLVLAEQPNEKLTRATLALLGPIATKKGIARGQRNPAATALTRLSGTVTRQVLDGGRQTLRESALADPKAKGWRRITGGNACDFCAAIAAEGVIGADSDFPAHDHCSCTQELAY